MAVQPVPYIAPEDYLAQERLDPFRREYYCGQIYAMAGASREHNIIAFNLTVCVGTALTGTQCQGFSSDMRIEASALMYAYPDLSVVCGEQRLTDTNGDTFTNPTVLIEILSPSTA